MELKDTPQTTPRSEEQLAQEHGVEVKTVRLIDAVVQERLKDYRPQTDALAAERNSIVIEDWFDRVDWSGKLAACMLHSLLKSQSQRAAEIGKHILERLQVDVVETEGLSAKEDLYVRELLLLLEN